MRTKRSGLEFNDARDNCREDVEDEVVRRPKGELIDIVMAII